MSSGSGLEVYSQTNFPEKLPTLCSKITCLYDSLYVKVELAPAG